MPDFAIHKEPPTGGPRGIRRIILRNGKCDREGLGNQGIERSLFVGHPLLDELTLKVG